VTDFEVASYLISLKSKSKRVRGFMWVLSGPGFSGGNVLHLFRTRAEPIHMESAASLCIIRESFVKPKSQ
jgi:hypothetical protein